MPRGRRSRFREFYVYRIFEGMQTLYVGKGCGRRLQDQERKFACSGEILEDSLPEAKAFKREQFWIKELHPTENAIAGGGGGWSRKPRAPRTMADRQWDKEYRDIERIGPRRYVARFLLSRAWPWTPEERASLQEVAYCADVI